MKSYTEKLQDPRWKKLRDEILERDDHTCQSCFSKERKLEVHHKYYLKGREPWDYSGAYLITLCEDCHEDVTGLLSDIERYIHECHSRKELESLLEFIEFFRLLDQVDMELISEYLKFIKLTPKMFNQTQVFFNALNKTLMNDPNSIQAINVNDYNQ
jgi:hypothetical protein